MSECFLTVRAQREGRAAITSAGGGRRLMACSSCSSCVNTSASVLVWGGGGGREREGLAPGGLAFWAVERVVSLVETWYTVHYGLIRPCLARGGLMEG